MSGGVDSSLAALRLCSQSLDVVGMFMKNWDEDDGTAWCSARHDLAQARAVCDILNIPLHTVNFAAEYWQEVFTDFLSEYHAGRTPNPDVYCNERIKFGVFLDRAIDCGAERIATGHYAQCREVDGEYRLYKAVDLHKDQSYFLYRLNQAQLARTVFPLGTLHKTEVRRLARQAGFANHDRQDSTGICFIGERPLRDFLCRYLPPCPGHISTLKGNVIGEHQGVWLYTLGQRQGLGIGGVRGCAQAPWYVVDKNVQENVLYVVQDHDHPLLFSRSLVAMRCHWIGIEPRPGHRYAARFRHQQAVQSCTVTDVQAQQCSLRFTSLQRAVVPGQSVVLYDDEVCLGGGVIRDTGPPRPHFGLPDSRA